LVRSPGSPTSRNIVLTTVSSSDNNFFNYKKATVTVTKTVQDPQGNPASWDNGTFTIQSSGKPDQNLANGGSYTYTDLFPGSYTFTEAANGNYDLVAVNGADSTGTRSGTVELLSDEDENIEFVNRQKTASVTIVKDVRDPLGNDVSDAAIFTARTGSNLTTFAEGSNGSFTLNPGVYTFTEDAKTGYTLNSITPDNDSSAANGTTQTLSSNVPLTITFTNYQNYGSISGTKFEDPDGVLSTTTGRIGLPGWTIALYSTDSSYANPTYVTETTTGADGSYSFASVIPGFYRIQEVLQSGWTAVSDWFINLFVDPGEANPDQNFVNLRTLQSQ